MSTKKPPYLVEEFYLKDLPGGMEFYLKDLPGGIEAYLESRLSSGYELVSVFGQSPTRFVFKAVK